MHLTIFLLAPAYAQSLPQNCTAEIPLGAFEALLETAEDAYGVEPEAFLEHAAGVAELLPCIDEVIDSELAIRLHQLRGLAEVAQDRSGRLDFAAAQSQDPEAMLLEGRLDDDTALQDWDAVSFIPLDEVKSVPPRAYGHHFFDGRRIDQRPVSWPTIYQAIDVEDRLVVSTRLGPDEPVPEFIRANPPARKPLLIASGVSGGTSLLLYAAAMAKASTYRGYSIPPGLQGDSDYVDEFETLRRQANRRVVSSVILGVTSVGLGTGAYFSGRW